MLDRRDGGVWAWLGWGVVRWVMAVVLGGWGVVMLEGGVDVGVRGRGLVGRGFCLL